MFFFGKKEKQTLQTHNTNQKARIYRFRNLKTLHFSVGVFNTWELSVEKIYESRFLNRDKVVVVLVDVVVVFDIVDVVVVCKQQLRGDRSNSTLATHKSPKIQQATLVGELDKITIYMWRERQFVVGVSPSLGVFYTLRISLRPKFTFVCNSNQYLLGSEDILTFFATTQFNRLFYKDPNSSEII